MHQSGRCHRWRWVCRHRHADESNRHTACTRRRAIAVAARIWRTRTRRLCHGCVRVRAVHRMHVLATWPHRVCRPRCANSAHASLPNQGQAQQHIEKDSFHGKQRDYPTPFGVSSITLQCNFGMHAWHANRTGNRLKSAWRRTMARIGKRATRWSLRVISIRSV